MKKKKRKEENVQKKTVVAVGAVSVVLLENVCVVAKPWMHWKWRGIQMKRERQKKGQ